MPHIGTLGEKSLHAALKKWVGQDGDRFEINVDGYVIDIVRGPLLIEIQTQHFTALKGKLADLLDHYPVRLVHPIPQAKWIVRITEDGEQVSRRKSPKKGRVEEIFTELVHITPYLTHPNLSVEVLLIHQEDFWRDDGQGSWRRRGWSVADHRLLSVKAQYHFDDAAAWLDLLPPDLPRPFTNRELATAMNGRIRLAQKMTYTLRQMNLLAVTGKQGNAHLHEIIT